MNQSDRIIAYIKRHGSINPLEAISDIGCYRLAARINDLRDKGYQIKTTTVQSTNRYDEPVRYASYSLESR